MKFTSTIHFVFIGIVICTLFCNCTPYQKKYNQIEQLGDTTTLIKKASKWEGVWGMVNYFEPIISNKEIATYHNALPATYSLLCFLIKGDSLYGNGSISGVKALVTLDKDTISVLDTGLPDRRMAYLVKNKENLELIYEHTPQKNSTSEKYSYHKNHEYQHFYKENFKKSITEYLSTKIISGRYLDKDKRAIHFLPNGEITGSNTYVKYEVYPYFGTLHPFLGKDMLLLHTQNQRQQFYHFKFSNKTLILTEFTYPRKIEYIANKKKGIIGDYYVLGKKRIKLIYTPKK